MATNITIRRIQAPTADELHQICTVISEATAQDSICVDGCANDPELYYTLARCIVSAAAAETHQFAAFLEGSEEVIGAVTFYEPGKVIMGDDKQRAHGFDDFLESLSPKLRGWWDSFPSAICRASGRRARPWRERRGMDDQQLRREGGVSPHGRRARAAPSRRGIC